MHPRQIVLRVRIAKCRRGKLEHLDGALGVGMHFGVGNSVQIVDAKRDQGARHDRAIAPVGVVLVVIIEKTLNKMRTKRGHWYFSVPFKLKISNLDQRRKDVLQILGCNVTAGVWAEIPENTLVEVAIVDVELMSSPTIFSVVISWILF